MSALGILIAWSVVMVALAIIEWRTDPQSHDLQTLPRCLRCDGMRDWQHRCPDAENAAVDTRSASV